MKMSEPQTNNQENDQILDIKINEDILNDANIKQETGINPPLNPPEETQNPPSDQDEILANAIAEQKQWQDKALRFAADLQNVKHQAQFDIQSATKSSKKRCISTIAPFLNTLFASFSFIPQDLNPEGEKFVQTLKLAFLNLIEQLKSINVEVIAPKDMDKFDPVTMNALNESEDLDVDEIIVIDKVASVGFKIDNQVTSPASVLIKKIKLKIDK